MLNQQRAGNEPDLSQSSGSLESVSSSSEQMVGSKEELVAAEKEPAGVPVAILNTGDAALDAENERKRRIRIGIMMSVAYAANIGGTASQIGSTPQLALKGILYE